MTESAADGSEMSAEDRRKHLDFIQAVVTRMSAASSAAKGWLLPVVTATYGYALTAHSSGVALLGMGAVALFGLLDANYLRQEQAYRRLYDTVARQTRQVPHFTLDPSDADDPPLPTASWTSRSRMAVRRWVPPRRVWLSWSIAPFHGGMLIIGAAVCAVA